ncbi:oligosaccharide repeat unit polymerase [Paeniclostridium sp. NSJ-45]|uniref:Oligosaccharide repeat unit polymerase n=1 Tax=Paeniclostridium hominis TaxID=2764329 RepID=A0ABR7K3Z6_9FIRM|nr:MULTISPECIES: oligosaccharide repeat unit polymerase [Paeniclostridium]MBC6003828.1 oligosaccharide repeat unit polymerase [Paeniclostridium hominis]
MIPVFQMILIAMIFQDLIQVNVPFFSYMDEGLAMITTIYALILLLNKKKAIKITKYELIALIFFLLYLFLGFVSNATHNIIGFKHGILSMIMTAKGYMLYFSCRVIFQYYDVKASILKNISKVLEISLYILALIGIVNIPLNFLEDQGMRFGLHTVSIGFSHPTELAFFAIISMTTILLYYNYTNKTKGELSVIIASSLLVLFTGRSKAIAFICVYIILFYFMKLIKKFKLKYFILLIPIMVYIALPRIISEFFNGARGYLYTAGYKIATDYFPLGTGFGTFGSYMSREFYSPLYYEYGLSSVWGLSPSMPSYIADTYWAMIMGETGFIGVVLLILVLYFIFVQFLKGYNDYKSKIITFGLICYTVVTSIAEPIYSSNKCAALFMVLALFMTIRKSYYEKINK